MRKIINCFILIALSLNVMAQPLSIQIDADEWPGVRRAAESLAQDFGRVTGTDAVLADQGAVIVGTLGHSSIDKYLNESQIAKLQGRNEMYLMVVSDERIVIAGSDKRGTIYGIYSLSERIGVSPWYWWADAPVKHCDSIDIPNGEYTDGEPAVRYRGIFLNDEAPCLTSWVANTWGTDYGGHEFYEKVFELLLRLKANFLWPAMWGWAFYADDPQNSALADEMGIIMGTSHHEPMARNHQEWARRGGSDGPWDYAQNKKVLDRFFTEGMQRAKNTEDLITIGMRGDGDEAMGGDGSAANIKLLENIISNQRKIIRKVTGQPAEKRPQVWALYKEVQEYYDLGLKVPDDVTILLSDDNWGDVRKLPNAEERKRSGGWGMYYHVDYVGAPRNSKWLNITPIQNLWEQMTLAYENGVDRLWVLNVGDLKPMEYPIDLFLDLAWNPVKYNERTLLDHTRDFFAEVLGEGQADEATRIMNLLCKYNGRGTAEMLDCTTYALDEWDVVLGEYHKLEAEALRQYITLPDDAKDFYTELILFPLQAMGNIHEMYAAQARNLDCARRGDPDADYWAGEVKRCFERDSLLCLSYNKDIANGKWDGMMTQKHIGYTIWNDSFPADKLPATKIVGAREGGFSFNADSRGYTAIEAEHYFSSNGNWQLIPYFGRTRSGLRALEEGTLQYKFEIPEGVSEVKVHVIVKSTLAYNGHGHTYEATMNGVTESVCFNENLNEAPQNIYSVYYPTVARRVVENTVTLPVAEGWNTLAVKALDSGIIVEKIIVDYGGYTPQFLFGRESVFYGIEK